MKTTHTQPEIANKGAEYAATQPQFGARFGAIKNAFLSPYRNVKEFLIEKTGSVARASGVAYMVGNVLIMVTGWFQPAGKTRTEDPNDRNFIKVGQGFLSFLHSGSMMLDEGNDKQHSVDAVIADLKTSLTALSYDEDGRLTLPEQVNTVDDAENNTHFLRRNASRIGAGFKTTSGALGVASGMRRGNEWDAGNGALNAAAFGYMLAATPQDKHLPEEQPARYLQHIQNEPSVLTSTLSKGGTFAGILAGIKDIWNKEVPTIAGLLQLFAYGVFFVGDDLIGPISEEEKQRNADYSQQLSERAVAVLWEEGILRTENTNEHSTILDTVSKHLFDHPQVHTHVREPLQLAAEQYKQTQQQQAAV